MSYKATGWVWEHATQTGSERLTLLALADVCNHEGECYPGVKRLADMVGVTHRRMQQILRKLETEKHLEIEYESGTKTKTGHTNLYRMLGYISSLDGAGVQSTTPHGVQSTTSELSVELSVKEKDSASPVGDAQADDSDTDIAEQNGLDAEQIADEEQAMAYQLILDKIGKDDTDSAEQKKLDTLQRGETVITLEELKNNLSRPPGVHTDESPNAAQTAPVEPDKKPKKERSEKQKANDQLVEALGKAYGVESSNGEFANYLRIAKRLLKDMTVDEFPAYVTFVRRYAWANGEWTVTLNSLVSGKVNPVSLYLASKTKPEKSIPPDGPVTVFDLVPGGFDA